MRKLIILIFILNCIETFGQNDSLNSYHFSISFPYINGFNVQANDTTRKNWGFLGMDFELDYGNKWRFWGFNLGACTDFFAPMGPVDIEGRYESLNCIYFNLLRNLRTNYYIQIHERKRGIPLILSYGLNYSRYNWKIKDTYSDPFIVSNISNHSLGLIGGFRVFLGKKFFIGYQYRPTFLTTNNSIEFKYQHSMSFSFGWRR